MDPFSTDDEVVVPQPAQQESGMAKEAIVRSAPIKHMEQAPASDYDAMYEASMKRDGVDPKEIMAEVNKENDALKKQQIAELKAQYEQEKKEYDTDLALGDAAGHVAAAGYGVRNLIRTAWNSLVDVTDGIMEFAKDKGNLGSGGFNEAAYKISEDAKDVDLGGGLSIGLGTNGWRPTPHEAITKAVTEIAAPMITSVVATGGLATGIALDTVVSGLLSDDKSTNLSTVLKGTALGEMPVAADVLDLVAIKPDDNETTRRVKVMGETLGLGGLVGLTWGLARWAKSKKALQTPEIVRPPDGPSAPGAPPPPDAPAPAQSMDGGAMNIPKDQTPPKAGGAKVAPEPGAAPDEPKPAQPADTPEQLELFSKQWADVGADGPGTSNPKAEKISLNDDNLVEFFYAKAAMVADKAKLRTPMTDAELAEAATIMKNDPDVVERIAKWTPENGVLSDKDTIVLKYIGSQATAQFEKEVLLAAANIGNDAYMNRFARVMENFYRYHEIATGAASAKGATMRAEQLLARILDLGEDTPAAKKAMEVLGNEGRRRLHGQLIDQYGGRQAIEQTVRSSEYLARSAKITSMPNSGFRMNGNGEIVKRGMIEAPIRFLNKMAFNGMVSAYSMPKSFFGNAVTFGTTVIDNYAAALMPWSERTIKGSNHFISGFYDSLGDALAAAGDTYKNPRGNILSYRMDLDTGLKKTLTYRSPGEEAQRASGRWAQIVGVADTTIEQPTKILASIDTFWNLINEKAYLNMKAYESLQQVQRSGKIVKDPDAFIRGYLANPPQQVLVDAVSLGETNTMMKELSKLSKNIQAGTEGVAERATGGLGVGKVIVPFMKTDLNSMEYGIMHSPFSALLPETRARLRGTPEQRDMAIAKMATGSMFLGMAAYWAHNGAIMGRFSENPTLNAGLPAGAKPSSIRIPFTDKWVSVQGIEPLETVVNMASDLNKIAGQLTHGQYEEAAYAGLASLMETITPENLREVMSDIGKVMKSDEKVLPQFMAELAAKYMPYSALFRATENAIDPTQRSTRYDSWAQVVKARYKGMIPWVSESLPPERDMFGSVIKVPDGVPVSFLSPVVAVDKETLQVKRNYEKIMAYGELVKGTDSGLGQYTPKKPGRSITIGKLSMELTPEEYNHYMLARAGYDPKTGELQGQTYLQDVKEIFKNYAFDKRTPEAMGSDDYFDMIVELTEADKMADARGQAWVLEHRGLQNKYREKFEKFNSIILGNEVRSGGQ